VRPPRELEDSTHFPAQILGSDIVAPVSQRRVGCEL